ncbi:MAG: serine/threonine protein kinase [Deltaproteobacteria bacterium]|nr:serine/threonine protein kinase [Deltaproteobacteria bacterium]
MEKIGKYYLKEFIASGGMAEIYKGFLEGPHGFVKDVVIKAIHPHLLKDERYIRLFLREARLWAKLNHSSIVQVYEFFEEKGRYYLVMEYVKGTDLLNVIKRSMIKGRPIGIPRTIRIFEYVLSALEYAHNFRDDSEGICGIVHRDISPQNILISVSGDVKITDFGIAKASLSTGITTKGAIVGKIDYMSPEQALGKDVDLRTDIFSTGIVLWETLTGNKLFDGKNDIELLENVRRCEIIRPSAINPEVDEKLEQIVMKSLASDPRLRYDSAVEFSNELRAYLREYTHLIDDEDIAGFMRELFPEYVKDYTHRTEILNAEDAEGSKDNGRKFLIGSTVIFLIILISLAVFLYPKNIVRNDHVADIVTNPVPTSDSILYQDISLPDSESEDITEEEKRDLSEKKEKINDYATEKMLNSEKSEEQRKRQDLQKKGRLSVNAIPWADVYIGKKKIGTTPVFEYEMKAGIVEIIFRNDDMGVVRKKRIYIEPEKETKHTEDLTK